MEEDDDRDRAIYVERNKHQASAPLEGEEGGEETTTHRLKLSNRAFNSLLNHWSDAHLANLVDESSERAKRLGRFDDVLRRPLAEESGELGGGEGS